MPDPGLSPAEARALATVLDEIIPPSGDGRLPGAGEVGVLARIEEALRENADLRPVLAAGLEALAELARERGAPGFAELSRADRLQVLNELAAKAPAFLPTLVGQTFVGYYQDPRVLEGLGLGARPPFPRGYEVEPTDFEILAPVRRRARMYREP
jgi:hypothetical protein